MPKIIQVSRSYERKDSKDFNSKGTFCSVTADIAEDEDPLEVSKALFEICKKEVESSMGGGTIVQPLKKDFWDTPKGEEMRERYQEVHTNFGEENGPRGSKFEG